MVKAMHHVALSIGNPARASSFFCSAMGFELAELPAEDYGRDTGANTQFLRAPNCYLELLCCPTGEASPGRYRPVHEAGITHFCVQSRHAEILHANFERAGASFHSEPVALGTGNTYCYARDPEENVIEIEGIPYAPADQQPWVAHVAFATPDAVRLSDFYTRVVGGTKLGGQKIGPNPLYDRITALRDVEVIPFWVASLNVLIEIWQFVHPPTEVPGRPHDLGQPGYSHICFEVDDLPAEIESFRAAGARFGTPVVAGQGYATAWGLDPDGNVIELLELKPERASASALNLPDRDVVARMAEARRNLTGR